MRNRRPEERDRPKAIIFFMIADPRSIPDIDTGFKASHENIFPTPLGPMRVPETAREYGYANSLMRATKANSTRRFYIAGNTYTEARVVAFD